MGRCSCPVFLTFHGGRSTRGFPGAHESSVAEMHRVASSQLCRLQIRLFCMQRLYHLCVAVFFGGRSQILRFKCMLMTYDSTRKFYDNSHSNISRATYQAWPQWRLFCTEMVGSLKLPSDGATENNGQVGQVGWDGMAWPARLKYHGFTSQGKALTQTFWALWDSGVDYINSKCPNKKSKSKISL